MGQKSSALVVLGLTSTVTLVTSSVVTTTSEILSTIQATSLGLGESVSTIVVQTSILEPTTVVSISSVITQTPALAQGPAATAAPLITSSISSSLLDTTKTFPASAVTGTTSAQSTLTSSGSSTSNSGTAATFSDQLTSPSGTIVTADRTQPKVGPFSPEVAILGGIPTKSLDVPVTAVFLVLFLTGAVTHFTIHELNGKRGHKFHLSDMVFDFCMVRTVTCTMRIVWAFRPKNNSIVLAAEIFENAGVVVLFAVNIVLTQRILRAIHPQFGWNPTISKYFVALLVSVPMIVIWNIISLTLEFFTSDVKTHNTAHHLLFFGGSYNLFLGMLPIFVLGLASFIPSPTPMEKFGAGRFRYKVILLLFASCTLTVGALIRLIGAAWVFPIDAPGIIDSKTTFYTTGFMLEIIVVIVYAVSRFDLKFHIPDGSAGPGDYNRSPEKQEDEEKLFEDVNVKMNMNLDPQVLDAQNFDHGVFLNSQASREQIKKAIEDLRVYYDIVGQPIDTDNPEIMIYAFRVQQTEYIKRSQRPQRTSTWTTGTRRFTKDGDSRGYRAGSQTLSMI